MSFGIRGSVATTIIIFILYNLNYENISKNIIFYGPVIQEELPKFIALLIIAIMLGFMSEENRKAEQRAYERMSKIVTLNEIKNSLKLDYDINSILKISTNSIMKIMNCNAAAGLIYNIKTNKIEDSYSNNIESQYFNNLLLKITPEPELYKKTHNYIEDKKEQKKIKSLLRLNLKINDDKYLLIFITKTFQPNPFNVTDVDLLKTLKVYLELLLKNNFLYKQIENAKNYLYFSFKNLPSGIIILDNDMYVKFVNTQALLLLKYNNEKDLLNKKLGYDIYLFNDKKIQNKMGRDLWNNFNYSAFNRRIRSSSVK
jgi:K+-sensing histidine kinase KdpD